MKRFLCLSVTLSALALAVINCSGSSGSGDTVYIDGGSSDSGNTVTGGGSSDSGNTVTGGGSSDSGNTVTGGGETAYHKVTIASPGSGFAGAGNYRSGDTVAIFAGAPPAGQEFQQWTTESPGVRFANAAGVYTSFIMPPNPITVTAKFRNVDPVDPVDPEVPVVPVAPTYSVTVISAGTGSTGTGSHKAGDTVVISAGAPPDGQEFANWTVTGGATLGNANSESTTFIMPPNAVTLTAVFETASTVPNQRYAVTIANKDADGNSAYGNSIGAGSYTPGTSVAIKAATIDGLKFKNWTSASEGVTFASAGNATTTFTMPANAVAVTANYDFVEYTVKVTSAGTGASGAGAYRSGAKVTIKAGTPPAGTQFKEWTTVPADLSVNYPTWSEATFTMPTKDVTVTAVFEGIYTLTADITPAGGGTVSRNPNKTSYASGEQVTLTATAASGYAFKNWSGASTSTASSVTVTISGNTAITANFAQLYTLTTSITPAGGGTVSRNPDKTSYASGEQVTVTATAASGYVFKNWSGASTATGSSVTVTMDGSKTLTANFAQLYTLTTNVSPAGKGAVLRNPDKTGYTSGEQVAVTATAASGYAFKGWSGASTATGSSVTITMDGNKTLTANFMETGPITDSRDGKTYTTTVIGGKRWMAQNLNYKPTVGNSWCYDDNNANCNTYGRLYDWNTAMAGAVSSDAIPSGVQGVCPAGWHLPSRAEWDELVTVAGGNFGAGMKLKSTSGWNNRSDGTSGNGTNDYGFSALPGGYRSSNGNFDNAGYHGGWWSATENGADYAYYRFMYYNSDAVYSDNYYGKRNGRSVRCVAD